MSLIFYVTLLQFQYLSRVSPFPRLEGKLCHTCPFHKLREVTRLAHPSSAPHRNALSRVLAKQKIKQVDTTRLETTLLGFYSNNNSEQ